MNYALPVLAYLLGAIPFGLIITRWWKGVDVREHGSHNIGFTNVLRVAGVKPGLIVLVLDIGKGAVPVLLAKQLGTHEIVPVLCGVLAILGHDWSIYLKFRGGKGVAATIGAFLALTPWAALVSLLILVMCIATTRYVSLGSMLFAVNLPIATAVLGAFGILPAAFNAVWIAGCVIALITVFKHRTNIQRLVEGTENQIGKRTE